MADETDTENTPVPSVIEAPAVVAPSPSTPARANKHTAPPKPAAKTNYQPFHW